MKNPYYIISKLNLWRISVQVYGRKNYWRWQKFARRWPKLPNNLFKKFALINVPKFCFPTLHIAYFFDYFITSCFPFIYLSDFYWSEFARFSHARLKNNWGGACNPPPLTPICVSLFLHYDTFTTGWITIQIE
jgi:hypothetical protein